MKQGRERRRVGIELAQKLGRYSGAPGARALQAKRDQRAQVAKALRQQGVKVTAIADQLGVDVKTVYRYLRIK